MKKQQTTVYDLTSNDQKARRLQALHEAAAALQHSVRSEAEVYCTFKEQVEGLGLRGGISLLDDQGKSLIVRAVTQRGKILSNLEKITGLKTMGFTFLYSEVEAYRKVIEDGETVFISDSSMIIAQILPKSARHLTEQIIKKIGAPPALYTPLKYEGNVQGVLNIAGDTLTLEDAPAIKAFANHIAIALNNARLIKEIQQEVQERKTAEMELRKLKDFNAGIIQTMFDGITVQDAEGHFTFLNPAAADLLGYSVEEAVGKHWTEIAPRDQWHIVKEVDQRRAEGIADRYELEVIKKDGKRISVLISGTPQFDNGRLIGTLAVFTEITKQKRMEESLRRRAEELAVLNELSLDIATYHDLPTLMQNIVIKAVRLLKASGGYLYLNDPTHNTISVQAQFPDSGYDTSGTFLKISETFAEKVAKTGEPVVIDDYHTWQGHLLKIKRDHSCRAILSVPMVWQSKVLGVVQVYEREGERRYSGTEQDLLSLFANQAAIAIENVRLYQQAADESRYLSLIFDVERELASSLEPDEILNRAVSLTTQELDGLAGEAFQYIPQEDRLSLRALYGRPEISLLEYDRKTNLRPGVGLAGWVAQHCKPANVPNVCEDVRWLHVPGVDEEVQSAISAPIMVEERLLGVITILHHQPAAFGDGHLAVLQAICQAVGLALSNASRYQEVKRRLTEITLIQSLTEAFTRRLELPELLDDIVSQLSQRFGYPIVEIYLIEGEMMTLRGYRGNVPPTSSLPIARGILGRVARTGQATFVQDVSRDQDYVDDIKGTVSELVVPIYRENKVVGVINIETDRIGQLGWNDLDLLQVLAGHISIALDNAILYERVRLHAENLEQIVTRRTGELSELYELSQQIAYALTYEELFRLLISHLRNAMGCEVVAACIILENSRFIRVETTRPLAPGVIDVLRLSCLEMQEEITESVMEQVPIEVNLISGELAAGPVVNELVSILKVPIWVKQRNAGMLIVGNENAIVFSEEQTKLLQTFANQAVAAIERLEALLAAEQKRLESLVEHLPTGVLLLDADFRMLVVNPMGREILSALNPGFSNGVLHCLGNTNIEELTKRNNDPLPVELCLDVSQQRFFEAQARQVGDLTHWVITIREVTQERNSQVRIQMQERLATVGQLAAGIAHDFNNIMAAILVYTDLLRSDVGLADASKDRLLIIQQQVQRASSLIRQILDFSRKSVMEQSALDLLPFLKEIQKMLLRVIPETIYLELKCPPGPYMVNADPTRLQQVLINLALNSRDAMPDGGLLHFGISRYRQKPGSRGPFPEMPDIDWICISIRDTGSGIAPENIPHIFEPFFTTKPVGMGTGLGLAQVYGIIKQHSGYIDAQSQLGIGTTFNIYLPALETHQEEDIHLEESADMDGGRKTVLVVEDDVATLEALKILLETHNFRVLTASNGSAALNLYEQSHDEIRMVISDVVMPQMGGFALYRALQNRWPAVKMLFITGHPMEEESKAFLETGSVHWLQKPFSVKEFSQAIRTLWDA